MKKIKEASHEYFRAAQLGFENPGSEAGFKAGVEFAQRWISVEDELPNLGDDIILKLREHPLKKYQVWHIFSETEKLLVSVYATHWRPIELK